MSSAFSVLLLDLGSLGSLCQSLTVASAALAALGSLMLAAWVTLLWARGWLRRATGMGEWELEGLQL